MAGEIIERDPYVILLSVTRRIDTAVVLHITRNALENQATVSDQRLNEIDTHMTGDEACQWTDFAEDADLWTNERCQ